MAEFVSQFDLAQIAGTTVDSLRRNVHILMRMVLKEGYSLKTNSPFMLMWDGRKKRKTQ